MKAIEFDKRVCVCGETRFYMMPRTFINRQTAVGLYCSNCGQWKKWMNRKDRSRFEVLCYKMEKGIN
nr:MAG TPA: Scavenger receptor cysteine-rich domain [Caudoviricetes sp.]